MNNSFLAFGLIVSLTIVVLVAFILIVEPYVSNFDYSKEELKYECELYANSTSTNIDIIKDKVTVIVKNKSTLLVNNYSTLKKECFI